LKINRRRPVTGSVRRTMKLALLCVVAFAMIAIIGRSVWRMSQRSSAVKDRAAIAFAGRSSLSPNEFAALFPTYLFTELGIALGDFGLNRPCWCSWTCLPTMPIARNASSC
jgi:hypothetical protein